VPITSAMMILTIARCITNSASTRRLPCQCPFHRIRVTWGRRRPGVSAQSTADPKPRPAHVAATAPDPTLTPVPVRPAAAGGGAARAAATPGSIRPTRPDDLSSWIFREQTGQLPWPAVQFLETAVPRIIRLPPDGQNIP